MDTGTAILVISFLGGGVASAIITILFTQLFSLKAASKERKLKLLEEQIRELYAPLFYLVAQSEKLLNLSTRIDDAYKVEFSDKQYSKQPLTRERVKEWTTGTIELANQYVRQVEGNNQKISTLLDSKFSYIDPDDIELFLLFFENYVRFVTERTEEGKIKTPDQIYSHLGGISYLRPEFLERVKLKFLSKKEEFEKLSR